MAVNIRIIGDITTNEYSDAIELKTVFERDLSNNVFGEILIICNVTLLGQEVNDVDLIVFGKLQGLNLNIKIQNDKNEYELSNVSINSFCFCIETKRHSSDKVFMQGPHLLVNYNNKKSDATTQSNKQKYSLKKYLDNRFNYSPYICNFIWLKNVNSKQVKTLLDTNEFNSYHNNVLPSDLNVRWLFQLASVQKRLIKNKKDEIISFSSFRSDLDLNIFKEIFSHFENYRSCLGNITRKKMEIISEELLRNQLYAKEIGTKLLEIIGRAGTGKTLKLLRLAYDLASNKNKRCIILTYNHALVSDIKRLMSLLKIPDGVDNYTVRISTLHKFFRDLLDGFNFTNVTYENYIKNYDDHLREFYDYL